MNWTHFVVIIMMIGFAVAIPWAIRNDELDAHLLHGPNDGCPECVSK